MWLDVCLHLMWASYTNDDPTDYFINSYIFIIELCAQQHHSF